MPEARPKTLSNRLGPETPIAELPGIGPKRAAALAERGISSVEDILFHLPARYQDWRERRPIAQLTPGTFAVVEGTLEKVHARPMRSARWRKLVTALLRDDTGAALHLVWFNLPSYAGERIRDGMRAAVWGRASLGSNGELEILHPELRLDSDARLEAIRPVYTLPEGVPQRLYRNLVLHALDRAAGAMRGAIPEALRKRAEVLSMAEALSSIHQPPADADLKRLQTGRSRGHLALAFDELFAFELAMCLERTRAAKRLGLALKGNGNLTGAFIRAIPFLLTPAQHRAIEEIACDLERPRQMNRILIGDVGSGKTAVAFWAALRAVESGVQVAMMAPTELLAEQHHRSFHKLCAALGVTAGLLTGGVSGGSRKRLMDQLASGALAVVFGTQALIQEKVKIANLGLAIIDEQHRFGVFDRARLKALGPMANVLMMTATPIPRSLAMTLFANLDVSVLDELPPGRSPVASEIVGEDDVAAIDEAVRAEIARGRRAYYVVPLIDGDEDLKSVAAMASRLEAGPLKHARIGVLHGRMRAAEKDRVMREFRDGRLDALVSTTVVEVGIDVPEATAIVVFAAERYGLAQLHQLRGRVGRGPDASRCFLVVSRDADEGARARIQTLAHAATGAQVARADLEMRGPGDLLGARQTGALPLRFVNFIADVATIQRAREMAEAWLARDPGLTGAASAGARIAIGRMLALGFSLADVS